MADCVHYLENPIMKHRILKTLILIFYLLSRNLPQKIYLEVYEGSSGPAIGGLNNAESLQAAETLKKLIEESEELVDYQYEGYYLDLDSKIHYGYQRWRALL